MLSRILAFVTLVIVIGASTLMGNSLDVPNDTLKKRFPESKITKQILQTDKEERFLIKKRAHVRFIAKKYPYYSIIRKNEIIAIAIVDIHKIRTKKQTLLTTISANGKILNIDVIKFKEPRRYKTSKRWLALLLGKHENNSLMPGKDLPIISGATMTSQKTSESARRCLQIVKLIQNRVK